MGSLAKRARQPESARGGGWAGGGGGANKLGRLMSAAKVPALYRLKSLASDVLGWQGRSDAVGTAQEAYGYSMTQCNFG
jgi:hypothetical protein